MDKTVEVIALYASATQNALVTLSKCLMENGALKPGQFSSANKPHLMRLRLTTRGLIITTFRFSRRCLMGRRREPVALTDGVAITTSL